jgi:hypothetical protein
MIQHLKTSLGDRRLWLSAMISAAIWLIPLFTLDLTDSHRTPDGWRSYWSDFTMHLGVGYAMMLAVSIIMHLLYRERVQALRGRSFWLFPIQTLFVAALLYSTIFLLGAMPQLLRHSNVGYGLILTPLYYWGGAIVVVFGYLCWLTYPLAILNQIIIRRIYGTT